MTYPILSPSILALRWLTGMDRGIGVEVAAATAYKGGNDAEEPAAYELWQATPRASAYNPERDS